MDHRKISRVLQMIARLRQPLGWTKENLASSFEVSVRTIERYIVLFRDLGFTVVQQGSRFKIEQPERSAFRHEDLIVFTLEEAKIIKDAMLDYKMKGPLRNVLLDKLFAMTDIDYIADSFSSLNTANVISNLSYAIREKQQVVLKAYDAADQKARDILVEPIRFNAYFQYLRALDVKTKQNKLYKTERITDVEITSHAWAHEELHEKPGMDAFGFSGGKHVNVQLRLSKRAKQLLTEEYPATLPFVKRRDSYWYFEGAVLGFEGVGRFVLGLPGEVKVLEPMDLQKYLIEKMENAY
jgi:proteasome accessory factor C